MTLLLSPTPTLKRHLRILYADDLQELRDVARLTLSREGHGIECVEDGQRALHRVQADPTFDLVVTDHHMPNLTGLELVHSLRALDFAGRIIVVSSELSSTVIAEYSRLNVDRIIYKPVHPSNFRKILGELFPHCSRR